MMVQQKAKDNAAQVWVSSGTFIMGSDPDEIGGLWRRNNWDGYWLEKDGRVRSELFPHEVAVAGFWMYRDLVTIEQYFRFMQETGHPASVDQGVHTDGSWPGYTPHRVLWDGMWCGPAYTNRGAQHNCYPPDSRNTNDHGLRPVMTKVRVLHPSLFYLNHFCNSISESWMQPLAVGSRTLEVRLAC